MSLFAEDISSAETNEQGLSPPRESTLCLGHDAAERDLLEQFNVGRMPHGIILSGFKGIGKATFAFRLARFLLGQAAPDLNQNSMFDDAPAVAPTTINVAPESPSFRQVASGGHADLLTIERAYDAAKGQFKGGVSVDNARKITPFLRMTASKDGGWRVVIVDDADTMNRNAQNAVLKILEEPPANTVIILVCHRLGAMIPTIRSRTRCLPMNALGLDHFSQLLRMGGHDLNADEIDTLYDLSEGSVGQAIEYIEQDSLETLSQMLGLLESYPRWSWPDIHKLADSLARGGRNYHYKNFSILLPWVFMQMGKAKARGGDITSKILHVDAVKHLYAQSSLETLLDICENLKRHFDRVDYANLDKRQAVLVAFMIIAD